MNAPSSWLETNVPKRFLGKNAPTFYQEQMSQNIDREPTPPKVDQEQKPLTGTIKKPRKQKLLTLVWKNSIKNKSPGNK